MQYFFIENIEGDAESVICYSTFPISKLYNTKRHYSLKYSDFNDLIDWRKLKTNFGTMKLRYPQGPFPTELIKLT